LAEVDFHGLIISRGNDILFLGQDLNIPRNRLSFRIRPAKMRSPQGGPVNQPLGKHLSLWIDSTPDTAFPVLEEEAKVDVAVVGAGITGITTGFLLKRAGKKVAIIDAHKVISGVTGHTTAKLTSSHGQIYGQLIKNSEGNVPGCTRHPTRPRSSGSLIW
jgi:hypothetical protein